MATVRTESTGVKYILEMDEDEALAVAALTGQVSVYDGDRAHTRSVFNSLFSVLTRDKYYSVASKFNYGGLSIRYKD